MERIQLKAAIYLLLIKDNKILLARRCNTSWYDGSYSVPSGHLEANETFTQGIIREASEEISIEIEHEDLEAVHVMHRLISGYVDVFFTTKKYDGEIKNNELDKCDDLQWFPLDNLPSNIIPSVRLVIEYYLEGKKYSEFTVKE